MRDISARIRRYRLSRYSPLHGSLSRHFRWAWPILGLWLAYVVLLSEHSLFRIWLMGRESMRVRTELAATRQELDRLERQMKDPHARRDQAEHTLRERNGYAGPREIVYRIPPQEPDSLR